MWPAAAFDDVAMNWYEEAQAYDLRRQTQMKSASFDVDTGIGGFDKPFSASRKSVYGKVRKSHPPLILFFYSNLACIPFLSRISAIAKPTIIMSAA